MTATHRCACSGCMARSVVAVRAVAAKMEAGA
jgi:hypothetical protein